MDSADKTESHPEELSDVLKMESSRESPKVNTSGSAKGSEDFLENEGLIENENASTKQNIKQDPLPIGESGSLSSSNFITNESNPNHSRSLNEENLQNETPESEIQIKTPSDEVNGVDPKDNLCKGDTGESKEEITSNVINNEDNANKSTDSSTLVNEAGENQVIPETSNESPEEWMDILGSGHLLKKVLKPGIPNTRPQKSDLCVLNLVGRLEDGTIVERSENLEINLSDNEVVQGLDFALALMDKEEEAEIKVTPRFGYGNLGRSPDIPPGANLIYTVTLLDVKEEPQISTLDVSQRIAYGLKKKERGNWWYSRDENTLAINCYRRALDYFDDTEIPEPHSEDDVRKLLEERLKTYNNLGAAQMKISAFDAALMSVNNVLSAQPNNVKALFRKAKILKEKGELQDSINVVKQALSHEPESQTLKQELSSLMAAQRKVFSKQRELYKKMMGNSNNQSDNEDNKKSAKNNYKTFTIVAAVSFAVALLSTIVVKYKF